MNLNPEELARLHELCDHLVDGRLADEDRQELDRWVGSSPAARRAYLDYISLDASLRIDSGALRNLPRGNNTVSPRLFRFGALQAAAMITLAGIVVFLVFPRPAPRQGLSRSPAAFVKPIFATLSETKSALWSGTDLPTAAGAELTRGKLELISGLATVTFKSGTRVVIEGSTAFEITGDNSCRLQRGVLTAAVPPSAIGFTVDTPDGKVVDRGTEFGINVSSHGSSEVEVFRGRVDVFPASGALASLSTGQKARFDSKGVVLGSAGELGRSVVEPSGVTDREFLVLSTAQGRGKATYVSSPGTTNNHSSSLMLVKNTFTREWRRKAYFAIDLEGAAGRRIDEAALTLAFEPTGFGFASRLPDAHFTLYYLSDRAGDDWNEATVDWGNAPGNDSDGGKVNDHHARRVGEFVIAQGEMSGRRTIQTRELLDALNSDRNGIATFVLVRDTCETHQQFSAIVHGFAGNRHPSAPPPSLRLRLHPKQ